jgi:hypothetical protein
VPEGDERTRQLPCPCTEIDDVARLVADEPPNRILGIPRATALVRPGDARERRIRAAHPGIAIDDHPAESRHALISVVSAKGVIR